MARIAFFPEAAFGPALNSVGIAQAVEAVGHKAVFLSDPGFVGVYEGYWFKAHPVNLSAPMPPEQMENALRATVRSIDAQLPLDQVQTMEHAISESEAPRRFNTALISTFAAIAVTLHDVLIWAMPAIYVAEYHLGCWSLQRPVAQRVHFRQFGLRDYMHWHVFSRVGWPTYWPAFIGSLFLAIPSAIIVYFLMRLLISRARTPQMIE